MDGSVYAFSAPRSSTQAKYTADKLAALAEQRRLARLQQQQQQQQHQGKPQDIGVDAAPLHLERAPSGTSQTSSSQYSASGSSGHHIQQQKPSSHHHHAYSTATPTTPLYPQHIQHTQHPPPAHHARAHSYHHYYYGDMMEPARAPTTSSSSASSQSELAHASLLHAPFELRHGRRYLREVPYPLPVDLGEIQRQSLRTLLGCQVFGRPVCSPNVKASPPRRVLEVGCGSGYWSAMCHEYFAAQGHGDVAFVGMDIAPLAPDLRRQGMDWTFVQHDLRRVAWPFESGSFDLIMIKDVSIVLPLGTASQKLYDESIRLLRSGGTLEIWESDHALRSLLPHPPLPSKQPLDQDTANRTATFLISPGTPFAPVQNKYLQHANAWIQEALDRRNIPPAPCSRIAPILYQEPDALTDVGSRRVAIPLGELRWERDGAKHSRTPSDAHDSVTSKGKSKAPGLTPEQAALRQTALLTVVQLIESLEPLLKEVSGKNSEEWSHWWASMMGDLLDPTKAALAGECLEMGAWWATRLDDDDDD